MLRDFGVRDVRVQEIVSLDRDMLACLPYGLRPIYGLIFLFKWRDEDADKLEASCPEGIWFANQTVNNACASVALLNIVNNIPDIDLGDHLQQFKLFTADFTPALRGDAIGNFEFVKSVHNSFARKMDMLNADLQLKNDASSRRKSKAKNADEDNAGFHFIAFVPVQDRVWKLDGLQRQPQDLGSIASDDWITHVVPELELRMAQYEEGQIEFVILALVKEPLTDLLPALAENIRSTISFSERLSQVNPDWEDFVPNIANRDSETSYSTLSGLGVEDERLRESIDQAELPPAIQMQLENENVQELLAGRQELVTAQAGLRASIRDQTQIIQLENERAARRRHDKGLLAKGLLQVLGRMGKIGSAFGNEDEY
ncbi:MAG: hypothetical protein Q9185_002062 [Variospora sp. 1 TL-2023]